MEWLLFIVALLIGLAGGWALAGLRRRNATGQAPRAGAVAVDTPAPATPAVVVAEPSPAVVTEPESAPAVETEPVPAVATASTTGDEPAGSAPVPVAEHEPAGEPAPQVAVEEPATEPEPAQPTAVTEPVAVAQPEPDPVQPAAEPEPAPAPTTVTEPVAEPVAVEEPEPEPQPTTIAEPTTVAEQVAEQVEPEPVQQADQVAEPVQQAEQVEPEPVQQADTTPADERVDAALTPVAATATTPAADDDLRRIEGIGPKMATALQAAGIRTYQQLAATSVADLRDTIRAAGLRAAPSLPTWPQQAKVLAGAGEQAESVFPGPATMDA